MKKYGIRLILWGFILVLTASSLFGLLCHAIAFEVSVGNSASMVEKTMIAFASQANRRRERAEAFLNATAEEQTLKTACEGLNSGGGNANTHLLAIRRTLLHLLYTYPQFEDAFLLTKDALITKVTYTPRELGYRPNQISSQLLAIIVREIAKENGAKQEPASRNIISTLIDENTMLVAVLPDDAIFDMETSDRFEVLETTGEVIRAMGRLDETHAYRAVSYEDTQTGIVYRGYLDLYAMRGRIRGELTKATLLLIGLSGACILVMIPLRSWVMRPFISLRASLEDLEENSKASKLISRLRKMREMRFRIFVIYCFCLIPIMICIPTYYNAIERSVIDEMTSASMGNVVQQARNLSDDMDMINRQIYNIAFSQELRSLLKGRQTDGRNEALSMLLIRKQMHQSGIGMAGLYTKEGKLLISTDPNVPDHLSPGQIEPFQKHYHFVDYRFQSSADKDSFCIVAIRSIEDDPDERMFSIEGYLYLQMDGVLTDSFAEEHYETWLLYDKNSWSLIDTPHYAEGRMAIEGMLQGKLLPLGSPHSTRIILPSEGKERLLVTTPVENTSFVLACSMSLEPIRAYTAYLPLYLCTLIAAVIFFIFAIDTVFTLVLTRLLRRMETYFMSATPDNHQLDNLLKRENEISVIAQAFSEVLDRNAKLNKDMMQHQIAEAQYDKRRRQSEVIALQSQMDSHLIANVFASMKLLLLQNDLPALRRMMDATGNFLRSGLVQNEYDVPLSREIDHVRAYIAIQTMRFGNQLAVDFQQVDTDLYSAMVPKYLLQPIIENAIKHGMLPKRILHVDIRIRKEGDDLSVVIENDGKGMSAEEVRVLNERLRQECVSEHIGLINVSERIFLRFGEKYGVHIESSPLGPTTVYVSLPLVKGEDNETV